MNCTCDAVGEGPCPEHAEDSKLQELIARLQIPAGACPDCGAEPGCNIDCDVCLFVADANRALLVLSALLAWSRVVSDPTTRAVIKTVMQGLTPKELGGSVSRVLSLPWHCHCGRCDIPATTSVCPSCLSNRLSTCTRCYESLSEGKHGTGFCEGVDL